MKVSYHWGKRDSVNKSWLGGMDGKQENFVIYTHFLTLCPQLPPRLWEVW